MLSAEIRKKIRQLEIHTRRMLSGALVGDSRSALKGSGFEFDQIRDYQVGDDIRFIDWHSSARMNKVLVKQYIEERSRTILLAVDVSSSALFSSSHELRADVFGQIASVLSLVANYGKDHVGLILFSDKIEAYIPPNRGTQHVRMIMEKVFAVRPTNAQTRLNVALEKLAALKERDALVFLISDFIDADYEKKLRAVAKKYDVVALQCLDHHETALPDLGFITMEDCETGQEVVLDMRSSSGINLALQQRLADQATTFKKCGVDHIRLDLEKPFINDLIQFFRRRMMY